MTRLLAFSLLVSAAIDWPTYGLDRAGVALLGLGLAVLAIAPAPSRRRAPSGFAFPPQGADLAELADELAPEHVDRVREYLATAGRSS